MNESVVVRIDADNKPVFIHHALGLSKKISKQEAAELTKSGVKFGLSITINENQTLESDYFAIHIEQE